MSYKFIIKRLLNGKAQFKKWSDISSHKVKKLRLNAIIDLLFEISGNDESIFNDLKQNKNFSSNEKYQRALSKIGKMYENNKQELNFKPFVKRQLIRQLKLAGITHKESRSLGFKCSNYLWSNCSKDYQPKRRGRHSVIPDLVAAIQDHLKSCSETAPNRTIKSKYVDKNFSKLEIPVYYRSQTLREIYDSFIYKEEISFASFCSYINPEFKKPHRLTDLCDICEYSRDLKRKLSEIAIELGYVCESSTEDFDAIELKSFIETLNAGKSASSTSSHINNLKMLNEYILCDFHKMISKNQRDYFNHIRKDNETLKNAVLIVADFKASVVLGKGPRELSSDFYERVTRTLIGFGIYYFDSELDRINLINVDIISHLLSTDGLSVIRCLRFLRKQEFFKSIEKNQLIFFFDTGSHFRCHELNHYLFKELAKENISVTTNYFCEQHGKSCRDQHFSIISKYLEKESSRIRIDSTSVIIKCLNDFQQKSNSLRVLAGLLPINFKVLEFQLEEKLMKIKRDSFEIPKVTCYYHFTNLYENGKWVLKSTVLSGKKKMITVNLVNEKISRLETFKIDKSKEIFFLSKPFKVDIFERKVKMIKIFMRDSDSEINEELLDSDSDGTAEIDSDESINDEHELNEASQAELNEESQAESNKLSQADVPKECDHSITNGRPVRHSLNSKCNIKKRYLISDLKSDQSVIGQQLVIDELFAHGHPKSRRINGKQPSVKERRIELIKHYEYFH